MKNRHNGTHTGFDRFLESFAPKKEEIVRLSKPFVELCKHDAKI